MALVPAVIARDGEYLERAAVDVALAFASLSPEGTLRLVGFDGTVHTGCIQHGTEIVSFIGMLSFEPIGDVIRDKPGNRQLVNAPSGNVSGIDHTGAHVGASFI